MFKKFKWIVILLCFSGFCSADYDKAWVQLGTGLNGYNLQFKVLDNHSGWSLDAAMYNGSGVFSSLHDRETGLDVDPEFRIVGVSKIWAAPFRWGFADAGIGLGVGNGEWTDNCEKTGSVFISSIYECDLNKGTRVGIPLQASAVVGKYIGIGLSINVFLQEDHSHAIASLSIPLGKFTK